MAFSGALSTYLAISARADGWGRRKLDRRLAEGKEDPERIHERRGEPRIPRPSGTLIWFHAASVGESLSLLEVIRRLTQEDPNLSILMTTGTVTSAQVITDRLPTRCIHQFVPIDVRKFVRGFLDHWKPDIAIFTESEIWPCLITESDARDIPLLLLNARLSEDSRQKWRWLKGAARNLLSRFAAIQIQDNSTATAMRQFGVPAEKLSVTGTLKEGTPPPPCDEVERARLARLLTGRRVWTAASTHPGEDELVLVAHKEAAKIVMQLLLILVPRHPERGDALAEMLEAGGFRTARRSLGEDPDSETQVLLADTLGELGLWYRLAPVCFVGGSLTDIGGHNPYEPAALGSAIIHGPHVANFRDIYERLDTGNAALLVRDENELGTALSDLMHADTSAAQALAAWEISSSGAEATDRALEQILALLPAGEPTQ